MDMITVEKRDFAVKAKKLRRLGLVPGSVFGGPLREALALQLEEADARRLVEQKREGSKLKIVLDGQQIPVQIKEKAVNLLNNDILHLSFQALQADQKVNSVIHIFLTNTEKVTDALERMLMEIPYASLPEDMIDTITVDVEGMPCGTVLTVGDNSTAGNWICKQTKRRSFFASAIKRAARPARQSKQRNNTDVRHYGCGMAFYISKGGEQCSCWDNRSGTTLLERA